MYFPLRGKLASGRERHEPVRVSLQAPSAISRVPRAVRDPRVKFDILLRGKWSSGRARHAYR
ncbi:hypothetical protein PLICRDRAFT_354378 [Plicaturopsis crispa FD-325 SS-3]|uniref:Uncharacterized protein n=1 Tax=Plicaturopsis crispa FD-325 SS-3 TaxID=944288 RepID=A0A0C9SXT9_PLICR|nr:hypothetical protein PLICRDRAFT_354378 [Plicaturopsis crispa FD-325 SS-3]